MTKEDSMLFGIYKKKTVELQCTRYVVRVFRIVTTKDKTEKFK